MNVSIDKDHDGYNDVEIHTKSNPSDRFHIRRDDQEFDKASQKSNSSQVNQHLSLKGGPNGKLSLETAGVDLLFSNLENRNNETSQSVNNNETKQADETPDITLELPSTPMNVAHDSNDEYHQPHQDHHSPRSHYAGNSSPRGINQETSPHRDHEFYNHSHNDHFSRAHDDYRDRYHDSHREYDSRSDISHSRYREKERESPEEIDRQKRALLILFEKLEKKRVYIPKKFTMDSNLDEMRYEYEKLKSMHDAEAATKMYGDVLKAFVSGAEYVNDHYNPFKLDLKGWSEGIHANIEDYDDVFEELHMKYSKRLSMPPEVKLLGMVVGSGILTHVTNRLFKNAPVDYNEIMRDNPDLRKQFQAASLAKASKQSSVIGDAFNMFSKIGGNLPRNDFARSNTNQENSTPVQRTEMRRPTNFDDILNTCQNNPSPNMAFKNHAPVHNDDDDEIKTANLSEMNEKDRLTEVSSYADSDERRDITARPNAGMRPNHREAFMLNKFRARKKNSRSVNKSGLILDA